MQHMFKLIPAPPAGTSTETSEVIGSGKGESERTTFQSPFGEKSERAKTVAKALTFFRCLIYVVENVRVFFFF